MSDIKLKKQINELRNSLFDKQSDVKETDLTPANINSNSKNKSAAISKRTRYIRICGKQALQLSTILRMIISLVLRAPDPHIVYQEVNAKN